MKRIKRIVVHDDDAPAGYRPVLEFVLHEDDTVTWTSLEPGHEPEAIWSKETGRVTVADGARFFNALEAEYQRTYVGVITVDDPATPSQPKRRS